MQEIGKRQKWGGDKVQNQKKQEIRRVGNKKKQEIKKVGCRKN